MSESPSPVTSSEVAFNLSLALSGAVASAAPSVVRLASPRGHTTSGTVWSDGVIVTTHRGTRGAPKLTLRDHDERELEVELVGRDPGTDLAVLRVPDLELPAIARVPADTELAAGSLALALARPGWQIRASLRAIGVVGPGFRTHQGGRVDAWIETDRSLPRGFSGGPLIDVGGRMIGLDTRGLVRHADLAIPLATVERVVVEVLEHGAVRQGWLGVSLVGIELPANDAGDSRGAVLVAGVEAEGPAAQAGVLVGDVLVELEGRPIEGPSAMREALRGQTGSPLTLHLRRAGESRTLSVTPSAPPE